MIRNRRLWVIIGLFVLCCSCKEYLDLKPYGETIPETPEEFEALLHRTLNNIDYGNDAVIIGNQSTILDYDCVTDNLDASLTILPQGNSLNLYLGEKLNGFQSNYSQLYEKIRDCNLVIENMTQKESAKGKKVLATAYTMRGICYYNLLRLFCEPYDKENENSQLGLPLVRVFDMEARPIRSSIKATAEFIEEDLKNGIGYNLTDDIYRLTVDVAKVYLMKLYFWTQNWGDVTTLGEELLKKYPLLEGEAYKDMIQSKFTRKGNVLIRSLVYGDESAESTFQLLVKYRPVSKQFIDLFVEKENDIRYELFFDKKRVVKKQLTAQVRSAEIALMLAEAYAHIPDNDKALEHLNALRAKRISNYVPYSLTTLPSDTSVGEIREDVYGKPLTPLLAAILKERQKELFLEGDRLFELKRNGCPEFWVTKDGLKYVTLKYMYTAPLSRVDVDLTPGLIQNEGYEL